MEKDPPSGRADTIVQRGDRYLDMRPLLSVIIPAYNCKDLLDDSAGSVLSQLPDNCELIIVDDGSSDYSQGRDYLEEAGESYSDLEIIDWDIDEV